MRKITYPLTLFLCLLLTQNNLLAQVDHTIGTGTTSNTYTGYPTPFGDYYESNRQQYLFLASELTAAGMAAGTITTLKWNITNLNAIVALEEYTIKIGGSTVTTLNSTGWETGLSTVYGPTTYTPVSGVNALILSTPYYWNGTDNIIVEVCGGDQAAVSGSVDSWSENASVAYTTVSGFNGSRTYRNDDEGNLCPYTGTATGGQNATRRPNTTFTLIAGPPPSCAQPTGLVAGSVSATGATLSWSAVTGASGYEWMVTASATPPATGTPITATSTPSGTLSSATTHYLHVRANCGANGYSFWSTISFNTLIANDNAVDATLLTVGTPCNGTAHNGTTIGATVQANEPIPACNDVQTAFNTVWFKFVAPASGMVRISTDNPVTATPVLEDSKIGVYAATNPADFNTYTLVACDEDNGVNGPASSTYMSLVYAAGLTSGTTYYIKVDRYDANGIWAVSNGNFCIDVMPIDNTMLSSVPNCGGTDYGNGNINANNNSWMSVVDATGKLVFNIKPNANALGTVTGQFNTNTVAVRQSGGMRYLDRNFLVNAATAPTTPVDVQFFFLASELTALNTASGATLPQLNVTRQSGTSCVANYSPTGGTNTLLNQAGNGTGTGVNYVQVSSSSFSNFYLHAGATPLTIHLRGITAANFDQHNRVDWSTASEAKGDMFDVERSFDGENFSKLSTIPARGSEAEYTYWDKQPAAGINYYRLRMIDAAGDVSYSAVVQAAVKNSDRFFVQAYPNPVKDQVTIKTFGAGEVTNATIIIADVTGKPVSELRLTGNQVEVNMSDFAPGIYFVKYKDSLHDQTFRISKQ